MNTWACRHGQHVRQIAVATCGCERPCPACDGTGQAMVQVQYADRVCVDELRPCLLCSSANGARWCDVKERPILFSAPMVRALLCGAKTQTRRVVKRCGLWESTGGQGMRPMPEASPYGKPGDRLWVRETCRAHEITDAEFDGAHKPDPGTDGVKYLADGAFREIENTPEAVEDWFRLDSYRGKRGATVPPIHMPRWASRIDLDITAVRVERLQDISEADAQAEGVQPQPHHAGRWLNPTGDAISYPSARDAYAALWEQINGEGAWATNPWVWVVCFGLSRRGDGNS